MPQSYYIFYIIQNQKQSILKIRKRTQNYFICFQLLYDLKNNFMYQIRLDCLSIVLLNLIVILMIYQQKKLTSVKESKKVKWVFDQDYNHYRRAGQQLKHRNLVRNSKKIAAAQTNAKNSLQISAKSNQSKKPAPHPQAVVLLKKYQVLPVRQRIRPYLRRNMSSKNIEKNGLLQITKYKRLDRTLNSKKQKSKLSLFNQTINKTASNWISQKVSQNCLSNDIQRVPLQQQNQTKLTHHTSSTKTNSYGFYRSQRQIPQSNQFKRSKIKAPSTQRTGITRTQPSSPQLPSETVQNYYKCPIPQQHQSLQSRTSKGSRGSKTSKSMRNQSSIVPGSKLGSNLVPNKTQYSLLSYRSSFKSEIFLPVNSLSISLAGNAEEVEQLQGYAIIQEYIQQINVLANYAQDITQNYENTQDWEQMIFLMYKKYYLARVKFLNALQYRNVLFFQNHSSKMNSSKKRSVKKFMNSENGEFFKRQILKQNIKIIESLRNLYNLAIEKSGNFINLQEIDNFTCQIFRLMIQQIQQLKQNYHRQPQIVKNRIKNVLKCAITITILDKKIEQQGQLQKLQKSPINLKYFQTIINFMKQKLI